MPNGHILHIAHRRAPMVAVPAARVVVVVVVETMVMEVGGRGNGRKLGAAVHCSHRVARGVLGSAEGDNPGEHHQRHGTNPKRAPVVGASRGPFHQHHGCLEIKDLGVGLHVLWFASVRLEDPTGRDFQEPRVPRDIWPKKGQNEALLVGRERGGGGDAVVHGVAGELCVKRLPVTSLGGGEAQSLAERLSERTALRILE